MTAAWRGEVAAVVIVGLGLLQGGLYLRYTQSQAAERAADQYRAAAKTRHAQILGTLERRKQSLETLAAFFQASDSVDDDEFALFGERLLQSSALRAVCWRDTRDEQEAFALGERALCDHFDVLEPSRALTGDPPLIVLSTFAASSQQSGFASIVFPISELFADTAVQFDEYLVANNGIQNTVTAYAHTPRAEQPFQPVLGAEGLPPSDSFDLVRLGSVQFFYLTHPQSSVSTQSGARTAALVLVALGIVGALYVRSLIQTRQRVRDEVEHRTAELSQFAYRTSHDIRGPLVTIRGLCQVITEDLEDNDIDEVVGNVGRIQRLAERLDALSGDILALTQADLGRPVTEPVALAPLIDDIHAQLAETFAGHHVHTEAEVAVDGPLMLSRARISQILQNLISNGIKYARFDATTPTVRTRVSLHGANLVIVVSDNGQGIPEEYLPRLFVMFERFHPDAAPGSGLGLPIVKKHVERLGGTIQVHSSPAGSTFTVSLPAIQQPTGA